MLSPNAEETLPTHNKVERGKRIVEEKDSSNSKLFSLLTEMMRRDEQFREELRWIDENMAVENRTREEQLTTLLQQRDEEWREEISQRDRALKA